MGLGIWSFNSIRSPLFIASTPLPRKVIVMSWPPRIDRLGCRLRRVEYDFISRTGFLYFPDGHCCDMEGAIDLISEIDSKVETIRTFSGRKEDTMYKLIKGEWEAYVPPDFIYKW